MVGDRAEVSGDQGRHLTRVLRVRRGSAVTLADGTGAVYEGRVTTADETVVIALGSRRIVAVPRPRLVVVHALPKGRKLDDVVQRMSEIGVDALVGVHSERSEVRLTPDRAEKLRRRWQAVALAAAQQSGRARLLEIAAVGHWADAFPTGTRGLVCWEQASAPLSSAVAGLMDADEVVLAIGPEGGLTPAEVAATGLPAVSLGPTVLRTETAALVATAILLDRLGRLS